MRLAKRGLVTVQNRTAETVAAHLFMMSDGLPRETLRNAARSHSAEKRVSRVNYRVIFRVADFHNFDVPVGQAKMSLCFS